MSEPRKKRKKKSARTGDVPREGEREIARGPGKEPFKKVEGSDAKLYGGVAAVALALVALVWWALPGDHASDAAADASASAEESDASGKGESTSIERPPEATGKLAVITAMPEDAVRKLATVEEIGKRLQVRHCGPPGACDAARKHMTMEDAFEIDVLTTDDLILPPPDTMDTVAPGLTPREREDVRHRKVAVVVRTRGPFAPEQVPARAVFAATAVLAEVLDGFVYDDVSRRLETQGELLRHTVTAPLGDPAFAPRQIVIQVYRQDVGTARLLTLGMARFGSPDLMLRGPSMGSAPVLADVMNAVASKIVHGAAKTPITITLDDVARVAGKKPAELRSDPENARPVQLTLTSPDPTEGDPENELLELRPLGKSTTPDHESALAAAGPNEVEWDALLTSLVGTPPSVAAPEDDKELGEIAKNARRDLPAAIKRFQSGEGVLFVKGPFPIPYESRLDGGASTELLWISATTCDDRRCTGVLTNEPSRATNLAAGKVTSVERTQTADWMLQQRDGGVSGGESIRVLKARAKR